MRHRDFYGIWNALVFCNFTQKIILYIQTTDYVFSSIHKHYMKYLILQKMRIWKREGASNLPISTNKKIPWIRTVELSKQKFAFLAWSSFIVGLFLVKSNRHKKRSWESEEKIAGPNALGWQLFYDVQICSTY